MADTSSAASPSLCGITETIRLIWKRIRKSLSRRSVFKQQSQADALKITDLPIDPMLHIIGYLRKGECDRDMHAFSTTCRGFRMAVNRYHENPLHLPAIEEAEIEFKPGNVVELRQFPRYHDFGLHPMKERLLALGHQFSNRAWPYDLEVDISCAEVANILSKGLRGRVLGGYAYVSFCKGGVYDMDKIAHILNNIFFKSWLIIDAPNGVLSESFACIFLDILRRQKPGLFVTIKSDRSELSDLPSFLDQVGEMADRMELRSYTDSEDPSYVGNLFGEPSSFWGTFKQQKLKDGWTDIRIYQDEFYAKTAPRSDRAGCN